MGPDAGADVLTESWLKERCGGATPTGSKAVGGWRRGWTDARGAKARPDRRTRSSPEPSEGRGLATLGP